MGWLVCLLRLKHATWIIDGERHSRSGQRCDTSGDVANRAAKVQKRSFGLALRKEA
eukprot:COSAG05_NODE_15407_length_370_cov_1.269373_2_plen_55_part_01